MVHSDISQLSTNFNSLRLGASSNMEGDASSAGDSPIASSHLAQQNNQNAIVIMSPEEALVKLSEQTKFPIMQENGQRRYGPPPEWKGAAPQRGCEVFIGKIPRDCFENELVPIFRKVGPIYMFRLMMDFSGSNRGYGFCIYTNREDTKRAVQELDNYEIRKGKMLGVCLSVDNCRLFVGGIPKTKTKHEILIEMNKVTEGVKDVIVYPSAADKTKNRGFAFVEYDNHKAAAMARRKLIPGRIQLWGHQIAVDWAEPEREVDEDVMSKVKILYVRNLMLTTTEDTIRDIFNKAAEDDAVERVKKIRDYAFVHFKERDQAGKALRALDDTEIDTSRIEVSWAKPVEKTEYVRYTRGGGKNIQIPMPGPPAFPGSQLLLDPYAYLYAGANATAVGSNPSAVSPNESGLISVEGSEDEGDVGNFGGRGNVLRGGRTYRNAAGSMSAGVRNNNHGYNVRDKKHPVEKSQQRQISPISCTEILEDICQKNGWGTPTFTTLLVSEALDPITGAKVPFYMGQVMLPNLCRQFNCPRVSSTPDEAKMSVAEYTLALLQYQNHAMDGSPLGTAPSIGGVGGQVVGGGNPPSFLQLSTQVSSAAAPPPSLATFAPGQAVLAASSAFAHPTFTAYSCSPSSQAANLNPTSLSASTGLPQLMSPATLSAATSADLHHHHHHHSQLATGQTLLYDPNSLLAAAAAAAAGSHNGGPPHLPPFLNPSAAATLMAGSEIYQHY